jgi:hypothetical protein
MAAEISKTSESDMFAKLDATLPRSCWWENGSLSLMNFWSLCKFCRIAQSNLVNVAVLFTYSVCVQTDFECWLS